MPPRGIPRGAKMISVKPKGPVKPKLPTASTPGRALLPHLQPTPAAKTPPGANASWIPKAWRAPGAGAQSPISSEVKETKKPEITKGVGFVNFCKPGEPMSQCTAGPGWVGGHIRCKFAEKSRFNNRCMHAVQEEKVCDNYKAQMEMS